MFVSKYFCVFSSSSSSKYKSIRNTFMFTRYYSCALCIVNLVYHLPLNVMTMNFKINTKLLLLMLWLRLLHHTSNNSKEKLFSSFCETESFECVCCYDCSFVRLFAWMFLCLVLSLSVSVRVALLTIVWHLWPWLGGCNERRYTVYVSTPCTFRHNC